MPKRKKARKGRRKNQLTQPTLSPQMSAHMLRLGHTTVSSYLGWCRREAFACSTGKDDEQRFREWMHHQRTVGEAKLRKSKCHRDPGKVLCEVIDKSLPLDVLPRHLVRAGYRLQDAAEWPFRYVGEAAPQRLDADAKAVARVLLRAASRRSKLLEGCAPGTRVAWASALLNVACFHPHFVRPIESWRVKTKNPERQFAGLVRHLFALYPLPAFCDNAWLASGPFAQRQQSWFVHLGSGKNLRSAEGLPVPLTSREAHHALEAPDDLNMLEALRYGQVMALGGDATLVRALRGTRLAESFENDDFWQSLLRFFVRHALLDRNHFGPIVDYLQDQKFERRETDLGHGRVRLPPRPRLSLKGRSPETLLREVTRWHFELGLGPGVGEERMRWTPSGLPGFRFEETVRTQDAGSQKGEKAKRVWRVRELLSAEALRDEGRAMRHCVASYGDSCRKGHCSIWSLESLHLSNVSKHLTVEVRSREKTIVQARGKANRLPRADERRVLSRWAQQAGLRMANYV